MVNPDFQKVLSENTSRYSFVVATAKRAREIADEAIARDEIITEKPVSLALEEIMDGKVTIKEK